MQYAKRILMLKTGKVTLLKKNKSKYYNALITRITLAVTTLYKNFFKKSINNFLL